MGLPLMVYVHHWAVRSYRAITLLIQRVSALAALGLSAVMMGAVATHLIHSEWAMLVVASMILIGTLVRAWLGRVEIASLVKSLI